MSTMVILNCVAPTNCGQTSTVPAFEDRTEPDPAKRTKPIQIHPYICLGCWRLGWRHDAPTKDGERWRVYRDENAPTPTSPHPHPEWKQKA